MSRAAVLQGEEGAVPELAELELEPELLALERALEVSVLPASSRGRLAGRQMSAVARFAACGCATSAGAREEPCQAED